LRLSPFCVASQRVFIVYFVIDSVRKFLVTPSYTLFLFVRLYPPLFQFNNIFYAC